MVHGSASGFSPGSVNAYGSVAPGNVPPLRSFTDSHSHFENAQGLASTKCG